MDERQLIEVDDATTETFELFTEISQDASDLGMLASDKDSLTLSIGSHDFEVAQKPGLLKSDNPQGTTGAAVWQSGLRFAQWLSCDPPMFENILPIKKAVVLELGAGTAGLVSTLLATKLGEGGRVIASDMAYAQRLLRDNIERHQLVVVSRTMRSRLSNAPATIDVVELDWEEDDAVSMLRSHHLGTGVDLIVACDCVYNYALIKPFLDTCLSICSMRAGLHDVKATRCIIVQQLRQPDVFEEWLAVALSKFEVWRVPREVTGDDLDAPAGYAVHLLRMRC